MATFTIQQLVKDRLFRAGTHDTETVTVTATMGHGSALVAANTEAAIADVATVAGIIDCPTWDDEGYVTGDVITVNVAKRGCFIDASVVSYSDAGAFTGVGATLLTSAMNLYV
ncbi:MAG: hypothetical protein GY928_13205 [Colwellia sp.]|nr:hypothetical protein [Colwellia sp.]